MDDLLLSLYQRQVESQCEYAVTAFKELEESLAAFRAPRLPDEGPGVSLREVEVKQAIWRSINSILNAAANLSKLLWPVANRKHAADFPDRGELLRASLSIDENSPLKHRTVRNHFEHVDERLESWWLASGGFPSGGRRIAMKSIGGPIAPLEAQEIFEQFDPTSLVVAFQGDKFELQPIATETSKLLLGTRAAIRKQQGFPADWPPES